MKKLACGLLGLILAGFAYSVYAQSVLSPTDVVAMVCANNTAVPSPTNGKFFYVQCDASGKLITTASASGGTITGVTAGSGLTGGGTSGNVTLNINVGQIPGIASSTPASSGNIGEYISSTIPVGSSVSVTSTNPANVTSISLPAGHWSVWGNVGTNNSGATMTGLAAYISTSSATAPTAPNNGAQTSSSGSTTANLLQSAGQEDLFLSTTTTVFLEGIVTFSGGTASIYGFIGARRVQ